MQLLNLAEKIVKVILFRCVMHIPACLQGRRILPVNITKNMLGFFVRQKKKKKSPLIGTLIQLPQWLLLFSIILPDLVPCIYYIFTPT